MCFFVNLFSLLFGCFTYTITPSADPGCTINPSSVSTVNYGASSGAYTMAATAGYDFLGYSLDNNPTIASATYAGFTNVTINHTIRAKCAPVPTCSLTATPARYSSSEIYHTYSPFRNISNSTFLTLITVWKDTFLV